VPLAAALPSPEPRARARVPVFSVPVISQIAPVGQTCEQSTQFGSQYPMRGTSTGSEALDAAFQRGRCSALLGHTFMQSPQRTQRSRKWDSSSEPAGG